VDYGWKPRWLVNCILAHKEFIISPNKLTIKIIIDLVV